MKSKISYINGIGCVEYKKSSRAKYLRICVRNDNEITVSVPANISFDTAETFVNSKTEWIKKSIQKINSTELKQTVFDYNTDFKTKFRTVKLLPDNRSNLRLKITDNIAEIYYPYDSDLKSESIQVGIKKLIEHVWKVEAHEYLPKRIAYLAEINNFNFKSLEIKNSRSFWGKCKSDNSIILSLHLMHIPDHLIDYVILHELCHTIHKNHQKGFWELLNKITEGKAKILTKEMKNHSTRVY